MEVIRAAIIDDHDGMRVGFVGGANRQSQLAQPPVRVVGMAPTVDAFMAAGTSLCDVVALDMSLADGSSPGDNVARLVAAGYKVLVYSVGDNVGSLQEALANGARGVSLKAEPLSETFDKLRRVAAGETIDNQDLAAAIEGDSEFVEANLSEREKECLGLYAAGYAIQQVARSMNISESSVKTNVDRIREKYEKAGRPAATKIDLYRRAIEDGVLPPVYPRRKR